MSGVPTAEIVCGKWTLLLIRDLAEGRSRFCELERSLAGISPRTLSLRLRGARGGGGSSSARHVPRGAAARRVRADREGRGAAADHRRHGDSYGEDGSAPKRERPASRARRRPSSLDAADGAAAPAALAASTALKTGRGAERVRPASAKSVRRASRQLETRSRSSSGRPRRTCAPRWRPARRCPSSSSAGAAQRAAGTPLYCYRALTGQFIGERAAGAQTPARPRRGRRAARALRGPRPLPGGRRRDAGRASGARAGAQRQALLEDVFDEQTDFELRPERVQRGAAAPGDRTLSEREAVDARGDAPRLTIASPSIRAHERPAIAQPARARRAARDGARGSDGARARREHLIACCLHDRAGRHRQALRGSRGSAATCSPRCACSATGA